MVLSIKMIAKNNIHNITHYVKTTTMEKTAQKTDLGIRRLLSVDETAEYLGISPRTIYNQIGRKAKRKFPVKAKRINSMVKFDIRDLDAYIDSL